MRKKDSGDSKKNEDTSKLAVGKAVTLDNGLQVSVDSKTEKTDQAGKKIPAGDGKLQKHRF